MKITYTQEPFAGTFHVVRPLNNKVFIVKNKHSSFSKFSTLMFRFKIKLFSIFKFSRGDVIGWHCDKRINNLPTLTFVSWQFHGEGGGREWVGRMCDKSVWFYLALDVHRFYSVSRYTYGYERLSKTCLDSIWTTRVVRKLNL